MREIEFRGKSKTSGKWIYGSLIIKKTKLSIQELNKELFEYKYSIRYLNKNGRFTTIEVEKNTIGQYVVNEEYCAFRLCYDNYTEIIESLDGLHIIKED